MDEVILVDEKDNQIGTAEKIAAHRSGKMHRAISVFVFNSRGELLLQKRAKDKYHSGGLWTNTCCSHPIPGESVDRAAHRRLMEEMGFECKLKEAFTFTYKVNFPNGLTEHEFDHVFIGRFDGRPVPDKKEAEDWKWVTLDGLGKDMEKNPGAYTYWLRAVMDKIALYWP